MRSAHIDPREVRGVADGEDAEVVSSQLDLSDVWGAAEQQLLGVRVRG